MPSLVCYAINSRKKELKMHLNLEEEVQPSMLLIDRDPLLETEQQVTEVVEKHPNLKFKLES